MPLPILLLRKRKLRHSLGRPSRSDFVQVEIMEIEHRNALESKEKEQSNAAMFSVMADVIKDPGKLQGILELANNPAFKKK